MPNKMMEIRTKEGKTNTNILLIAPHGVDSRNQRKTMF